MAQKDALDAALASAQKRVEENFTGFSPLSSGIMSGNKVGIRAGRHSVHDLFQTRPPGSPGAEPPFVPAHGLGAHGVLQIGYVHWPGKPGSHYGSVTHRANSPPTAPIGNTPHLKARLWVLNVLCACARTPLGRHTPLLVARMWPPPISSWISVLALTKPPPPQ